MNELALFAGAGGGILGGKLLGWRCVCAVEIDKYCRDRLMQRQNEGHLQPFPVWDNVKTFDGRPWRGVVDVVSGGFPCQDISVAGKGAGIDGERSGLWSEFARIIGEVRPRYVLVENSPALVSRGLGRVLGDLSTLGYDAKWGVLGAHHVGAPHKRDRIWIVANAMSAKQRGEQRQGKTKTHVGENSDSESNRMERCETQPRITGSRKAVRGSKRVCENVSNAPGQRLEKHDELQSSVSGEIGNDVSDAVQLRWQGGRKNWDSQRSIGLRSGERRHQKPTKNDGSCSYWWEAEPQLGRVAHGVAHRMDRLKALGNGQVPAVVAVAWEVLK